MNLMSRRHPLIDSKGLSNDYDLYSLLSSALAFPDLTNTSLGREWDLRIEGVICGVMMTCGLYRNHDNYNLMPVDEEVREEMDRRDKIDQKAAFARIKVCNFCKRHLADESCPEHPMRPMADEADQSTPVAPTSEPAE